MFKAKGQNRRTGDPLVILGLSHENLRRLKAGQPIVLNLAELELPATEIMIFSGKTEDGMRAQLAEHIDLGREL